jgi:hypothetical protein
MVNALIRQAFAGTPGGRDFEILRMVRLLIGHLLIGRLVVGGRRRPSCQLQLAVMARTVSRWLTQFTMCTVECLHRLNAAVITHVMTPTLTLCLTNSAPHADRESVGRSSLRFS